MNVSKTHIIIISFVVFIILNIIENILHYNIGRNYNEKKLKLLLPSKNDFYDIICIMFIFALLQGLFTEYFL